MGKHERGIVEEAEVIAAILINNRELTIKQKNHPFLDIIKTFVDVVKKDFKNIEKAVSSGNTYSSRGDIILNFQDNTKQYIELKFLEQGFGTLANISQDALTSLGIFKCDSWSDFRKNSNHREFVIKRLNDFKYPFGKIKVTDPKSKIYKAAGYLKYIIDAGSGNVEPKCREILKLNKSAKERLAAKIILDIIKMDKDSRKKYLKILSNSKLDHNRLKNFVILLLSGSHTNGHLEKQINLDLKMENKLDDYSTYYLYKKTGQVVKEYSPEDLYMIDSKYYDVKFKEDETNLIIFIKDGNVEKNLLRVVFHWKNKFGGIQTPCLNIFRF